MARAPKKKGTSGAAVQFLTRSQAIRKTQLNLIDFRRLCILKGIYPRDPSKKVKGKDKTYYATKDILFLMHDPVLSKIREIKAHNKKIVRARGVQDRFKVKLLEKTRPFYMIDHILKERFPTFIDAVRDMDDALCMTNIFANLPSDNRIEPKRTQNCGRLFLEFTTYVAMTHSLQKVFLSIKGCYMQAEVMGQPVTWLVPYELGADLPHDVDYRVMLTFLELYETQLRFINYKLFTGMGLVYPPKIDQIMEAENAGMSAVSIEKLGGAQPAIGAVDSKPKAAVAGAEQKKKHANLKSLQGKLSNLERGEQDGSGAQPGLEEDLNVLVGDGDEDENEDENAQKDENLLFKGLKIFISREVSRKIFELVARSFGARVGWDGVGSPFKENDEGITHQIVDRDWQKRKILSREYVQPQWLADSANAGLLMPVEPYAPGHPPPPHLSPFVNDEEEGYVPDQRKLILSMQQASHDHQGTMADEEGDEAAERSSEEDNEDEEEEGEEEAHQREIEAERSGKGSELEKKKAEPASRESRAQKRAREEEALAKLMMPKKDKRLYEKIKFGQARKAARVANLESKKA